MLALWLVQLDWSLCWGSSLSRTTLLERERKGRLENHRMSYIFNQPATRHWHLNKRVVPSGSTNLSPLCWTSIILRGSAHDGRRNSAPLIQERLEKSRRSLISAQTFVRDAWQNTSGRLGTQFVCREKWKLISSNVRLRIRLWATCLSPTLGSDCTTHRPGCTGALLMNAPYEWTQHDSPVYNRLVSAGFLYEGMMRTTVEDIQKNYLQSLFLSKDRDLSKPKMPLSTGLALIFVSVLDGTKLM